MQRTKSCCSGRRTDSVPHAHMFTLAYAPMMPNQLMFPQATPQIISTALHFIPLPVCRFSITADTVRHRRCRSSVSEPLCRQSTTPLLAPPLPPFRANAPTPLSRASHPPDTNFPLSPIRANAPLLRSRAANAPPLPNLRSQTSAAEFSTGPSDPPRMFSLATDLSQLQVFRRPQSPAAAPRPWAPSVTTPPTIHRGHPTTLFHCPTAR